MRVAALLLLVGNAATLRPTPHVRSIRPPTLSSIHSPTLGCRAVSATMMRLDDGSEEESEDFEASELVPYEDWNLAWNRYSLEYLAETYDVSYEYVDLPEQPRNPVGSLAVGATVACVCIAIALHAYIQVTGGIVIAPGTSPDTPIELHNFNELEHLSRAQLTKLQIPGTQLRDMMERALQSGELAGWRSLLVSNTFTIVLDGAL